MCERKNIMQKKAHGCLTNDYRLQIFNSEKCFQFCCASAIFKHSLLRICFFNTHIELVERRGGGVEKSQEGILGILVLDTYRHRTNNTSALKYGKLTHQRAA